MVIEVPIHASELKLRGTRMAWSRSLVEQCAAVRAEAARLTCCQAADCATLARFVGKLELLIECLTALNPTLPEVRAVEAASGDIADALASVHDIVSNLTHMSRLHALLCQDDGRDAYHAAATDLRCAAATLDPVRLLLPTDCQEDHAAVVRQLAELRFLTCPTATAAAAAVIEALVLAHNGVISSTAASTVFEKALAEAGLPATVAEAPTWADSELRRLARAAIEAERRGDPIEAFLLSQLALFLAAWGCGATHGQENTVLNAGLAAGLESKCDCPDGGDAKDDSRVWQAPYQETHGIKCVKCHLNLSPLTLEALAACQKRTADAAQEARLPQADIASWCHHLCTSSAVPLRQYAAAVLVGHAAEDRQAVADLLAAGAIPGLRAALEEGRHPMVRSAAAYGLRTLCRDPAARSNAAAAGCLVPLSRQLAAKRVGPRRAAARALGNLFLAGESCKLQAERLGVAHSLIAMLSFDDVMGREAAAAALANLVANSADLQLAVGRLDIFPALCTALHSGTQPAKQHAARVLRNLTSRQGSNKIKAASAGAVPCLIALMRSEDAGDRSAAAAALANLICGCTLAREEASAKGAVPLLLDMLDGAESPAGKEAALSALATILGQVEPPSVPSELVTRDHVAEVILLLQSGPETSRRAAVRLVKALAAGWGGRRKAELADAGAVTPLVALLTAQELATRQTAAAAVRVLAHKCDSNRHSFIQAGVASPLVGLLSMDCHGLETDHTREEAASALAVLTANNHYRQGEMIAAAGAIPPLVAILQAEDSRWETLAAAASTLANLACLPACQEAVLHAGTVALLLRLLRSHSPAGSQADLSGRSRCQEAAARALANLAADSLPADIAAALPQTASLLAQLALEESNPQGQISAATALGNLACSGAAAAEAVAASGAPAALVAMCRSPMHAVREGGVLALLEVCSGAAEGRRALVHAGAVPWLAQLLLIGEDSVKEASALCIAELAKEGAAVKKAVERSGAAATLKNLAGCGSDGGDEGDPGMAAVAAAAAAALAGLQRSGAGSGEESEGEGTLRQLENTLRLSLRASGSKLWGSGMIESE